MEQQIDPNAAPVIGMNEIHRMLAEDRIQQEQLRIIISRKEEELQFLRQEVSTLRQQLAAQNNTSSQEQGPPENVTTLPVRS